MTPSEFTRGEFLFSPDKSKLDIGLIHRFLSEEAYWSLGIPLETFRRAIAHSTCFGVYHREEQVGFCRVISDLATYAHLADVFVLPEYRGRGLAIWMVGLVLEHPDLQGLRRWTLGTMDAHGLYHKLGFTPLSNPERWMSIYFSDVYRIAGAS